MGQEAFCDAERCARTALPWRREQSRAHLLRRTLWTIGGLSRAPSLRGSSLGNEYVDAIAHRADHARIVGIVAELAAEAADLDVHAAIEGGRIPVIKQVEQLIAAEHAIGMGEPGLKQLEFPRGQRHRFALVVAQSHATEIGVEAEKRQAASLALAAALGARVEAAHDAAHAGDQLARREGLGQVVVGADLEADAWRGVGNKRFRGGAPVSSSTAE